MSPLSVENIIYLKFTLLKTVIGSWFVLFSASMMADKNTKFYQNRVISTRGTTRMEAGGSAMHGAIVEKSLYAK